MKYMFIVYIIHKDEYAVAVHQAEYLIILIPTQLSGMPPLSITPELPIPITQMISGLFF